MAINTYNTQGLTVITKTGSASWVVQDRSWLLSSGSTSLSSSKTYTIDQFKKYNKIKEVKINFSFWQDNTNASNKTSISLKDTSGNKYYSYSSSVGSNTVEAFLDSDTLATLNTNKPVNFQLVQEVSGIGKKPTTSASQYSEGYKSSVSYRVRSEINNFTLTITYTSGTCRRWNGTGWEICEVYRYNGTNWESCELYRINSEGKKELCE